MSKESITVEVVTPERALERASPAPRPQAREVKSLFDGMVIPMPASMPPAPAPPTVDEVSPRPDVEVLSAEEVRQHEQRAAAPPPDAILETSTVVRPSLVPHIEVDCEALLGFLTALARIAPMESPSVLSSVKLTFKPSGEEASTLYIETSNAAMWALVSMAATGGDQDFAMVMPLQRSINILKYLRGECKRVLIGLDAEQVHLGPLSMPFGGSVHDFPPRAALHTVEARAVVPAYYLEEVCNRLAPVLGTDVGSSSSSGIHIDFAQQAAVASNGSRFHILRLPRMGVESRLTRVLPPAVTVAPEFFSFLTAVVDRDWTAMQINANQIAASGEDYAVVARCAMGDYERWKTMIRHYQGHWVFDKAALQEKLTEAMSVVDDGATLRIRLDVSRDHGILSATAGEGEFQEFITAKRYDNAPAVVNARVGLYELWEAVDLCHGGLVRIAFDNTRGPHTEPVVVQGEDNDFMAILPTSAI